MFLNSSVVTQYASALNGLNKEQALLALSSKKLTIQQKEQILANMGLIASENAIQSELIKTTLAQRGVNTETANAILIHLGLMDANTLELFTQKACTKADLEAILVQKGITGAQLEGIMSTLGLAGANTTLTASFKTMKRAVLSSKLFANPISKIAIILVSVGALIKLVNKFNKEVLKSTGQNESLEKRIESLQEDCSKYSSELDEINSKLSENEEKIKELTSLKNPTYVDEEDLNKLREQNKLLKEIAQYKQEEKDNAIKGKNEALNEKLYREYFSTESENEDLVEYDDSFWGGLWDGITFKGVRGLIDVSNNIDSQYDKDIKAINNAESLRLIEDALLDKSKKEYLKEYQELIDERSSLGKASAWDEQRAEIDKKIEELEHKSDIDLSMLNEIASNEYIVDYDTIQELINKSDESLKEIRRNLLNRLAEYDETDPYYESDGAKAILNMLDGINKYLNPDDWIAKTVDKIYNMDSFSEIRDAIETKIKNGDAITFDSLLTDETYHNLVKRISLALYNSADDESLRKAANYLYKEIEKNIKPTVLDSAFLSISESIKQIADQLEPQFAKLGDAYKEIFTSDGFTLDNVDNSMLEDLRSTFADIEKELGVEFDATELDDFFDVITSTSSTADDVQNAFNSLATSYLNSTDVLESLNEETAESVIQQLEQLGVTNAQAIVEEKLRIVREEANASKELENIITKKLNMTKTEFAEKSYEDEKALLAEAGATDLCIGYLAKLKLSELDFNKSKLSVDSKIEALENLAKAYGLANTEAKALAMTERQKKVEEYEKQTGANTGFQYTEADFKKLQDEALAEIEAQFGNLFSVKTDLEFDGNFGLDEDSTKDSTDNIFDWIETRISRLQNAFQNMVDSVTKYVSQNFKLDSIDKQITSLDEQISTYYAGAEKYLEKANSITLSDDLRNKVINGKIEIEEISDETTRESVNEFKEWYEKYLDAIDNAAQLERDKRDKLREKLDARTWALQQQRERLSTKSDRKQDAIDFKESLEGSANTSEYQWLINNADKQYENINAENSLLKEYLATLDSTSEEWADIQSQIESNESSMRDLISSQVEWNNKIAQMPIDKAEKAIEKLSGKEERINAKYENTNSSWAKRQLNDSLADIKTDTLKQYRNAYETTKDNFNTSAYNINQMSSKDSLVAKVQKYTKSGKEIPSDVLSSVYGSGNTLLIRRCEQYNAAYLARETAKDTYDLNKEQIKTDLADLGQKNLDTITDAYANKNTTIDNKKSLINARKENTEAKGKYADESYYNQLLTQVSRQVDAKVSERNKLKEIIDQNIKDGLWTKESQMYKDAMAQVDQLGIEIVELSTEQANYNNELNQMPIDRLQTALDILDKLSSRDSSKNDLKKALGKDLSVNDYQKEFNNIKAQEDKTLQLRNKYYQKYINAKQKGRDADADKYLQLYYEEDTALNNLKVSFEELKDEMRDDVYWRDFERAHNAAENLKTTIASIIDLYSDEMLFSDNGAFTDMGVSKMGALLKEYELAKTEVVNYTNDLKNLNNLYDTGMYTEEEYKEKLAEIKNGLLDATKETKSYNDALRDMVISQKEIELEALNELIDKRKEALNAKKEYYDYDKNIKEKTKEIQSLQAQVAALEGVETAEAKAQLARAKSELQEAQDDLEETKFDHKLEVILDGFDLLQTDLQENHDAYVKNLKSSFDEQIEIISNANSLIGQSYSEVIRSITNMLQFYGVDTSSIDVGSLAGFATGGIVRAVRRNGDSALVSVNPDETILTKKFTDLLPDTVQMMSQFVNIPKMNYDFAPRRNDTPVINISYDKMLHIEGNVFDMEKATMDVVKNNMKTIAKGVSNDLSTQWRKLGHK